SPMRPLRGALYLHAAAWFGLGLVLALWPRVLQAWLGQPPYPEHAWVRIVGILLVGASLQMVLVGHRVEELWWWSWSFVFTTGSVAALLTLNAAFGVPEGGASTVWWVLALAHWGLASLLLLAMQRAATERPLDRHRPAPARDPHPRRPRR
ncbi:MAG TPA: hypothetical protein VE669_10830, partial [Actinomycetota bacterium]|nr:hypothetical protein [Actinomycetota bacterium]